MSIPVGLSTTCMVPGSVPDTFTIAQELGYNGIEIMIWSEKASQDATRLAALVEKHDQLALVVHTPTLPVTRGVFDADLWDKVDRSIELVHYLEVPTVALYPPFFWQIRYARSFIAGVAQREATMGIHLAVENMLIWRPRHAHSTRDFQVYLPTWNPVGQGYKSVTLDISHAAAFGSDALAMARALRSTLRHLHLTDGVLGLLDDHLLSGQGNQDCAEVLKHLVATGFEASGRQVVVEVTTRSMTISQRFEGLASVPAFAREHLEGGEPAHIPEPTRKRYRRS